MELKITRNTHTGVRDGAVIHPTNRKADVFKVTEIFYEDETPVSTKEITINNISHADLDAIEYGDKTVKDRLFSKDETGRIRGTGAIALSCQVPAINDMPRVTIFVDSFTEEAATPATKQVLASASGAAQTAIK